MTNNTQAIVLFNDDTNIRKKCLCDRIMDNIYIGNVETAENEVLLAKNNIKRVVNVTHDKDNFFEGKIEYFNLRIEDRRTKFKTMKEELNNALDFITSCSKNTLIHCNAGTSRSGTVLLAYVMKTKKITLKEAFEYILNRRSVNSYTHPNIGFFQKVLLPFEKELFGETSMTLTDYQFMETSGRLSE